MNAEQDAKFRWQFILKLEHKAHTFFLFFGTLVSVGWGALEAGAYFKGDPHVIQFILLRAVLLVEAVFFGWHLRNCIKNGKNVNDYYTAFCYLSWHYFTTYLNLPFIKMGDEFSGIIIVSFPVYCMTFSFIFFKSLALDLAVGILQFLPFLYCCFVTKHVEFLLFVEILVLVISLPMALVIFFFRSFSAQKIAQIQSSREKERALLAEQTLSRERVRMAVTLADRLNSPLLVLQNTAEHFTHLISVPNPGGEVHAKASASGADKELQGFENLRALTSRLAELRESSLGRWEATKLLTEESRPTA